MLPVLNFVRKKAKLPAVAAAGHAGTSQLPSHTEYGPTCTQPCSRPSPSNSPSCGRRRQAEPCRRHGGAPPGRATGPASCQACCKAQPLGTANPLQATLALINGDSAHTWPSTIVCVYIRGTNITSGASQDKHQYG